MTHNPWASGVGLRTTRSLVTTSERSKAIGITTGMVGTTEERKRRDQTKGNYCISPPTHIHTHTHTHTHSSLEDYCSLVLFPLSPPGNRNDEYKARNVMHICLHTWTTWHHAQTTCMHVVVQDGMLSMHKGLAMCGMLTKYLSLCTNNISFVQDAMLSTHKASNVTCHLARTVGMHVDMSCAMGHSV